MSTPAVLCASSGATHAARHTPPARACPQIVKNLRHGPRGLTRSEFERIQPHLPDQTHTKGRERHDDHRALNAILWALRTGAPWRNLPERYGPWKTANSTRRPSCANGWWGVACIALGPDDRATVPVVSWPTRGTATRTFAE